MGPDLFTHSESLAAHQLAIEISTARLIEFAVVFAMIWLAWINGSLYLEFHGRDDGRTRSSCQS